MSKRINFIDGKLTIQDDYIEVTDGVIKDYEVSSDDTYSINGGSVGELMAYFWKDKKNIDIKKEERTREDKHYGVNSICSETKYTIRHSNEELQKLQEDNNYLNGEVDALKITITKKEDEIMDGIIDKKDILDEEKRFNELPWYKKMVYKFKNGD
jgi:hypothetical protein